MNRIAVLTASAALLLAGSGLAIAGSEHDQEMQQGQTQMQDMQQGQTEMKAQTGQAMEEGQSQMQAQVNAKTNVYQGAVASPNHTTLVRCIDAAELQGTLEAEGPYTVFAPTNAAFDAMGQDKVNSLMKPENKAQLTEIVIYHVVPGRIDSKALAAKIKEGNGKAVLTTVRGQSLTAQQNGNGEILLVAADGSTAKVTGADMHHSNGVIHAVDTVLKPQ